MRATGQEKVLPVFGFEEEAQMFIHLAAPEDAWRVRQTSAGQLVSLLYGPCSGVARIVLDPIAGIDSDISTHVSFGRREFVAFLCKQPHTWLLMEAVCAARSSVPFDRAPRGSSTAR